MRQESLLSDDWYEKGAKGFFIDSPPPPRGELESAIEAIHEMVALILKEHG